MRKKIKLDNLGKVGCDRINLCKMYSSTNPNLRQSYCYSLESENCLYKRKDSQKGMFTSPRKEKHYFS